MAKNEMSQTTRFFIFQKMGHFRSVNAKHAPNYCTSAQSGRMYCGAK